MSYLKQGQEALLSMFGKPPGSKPEYRGAGQNRNTVEFLRYKPDNLSPRLEKSLTALRDKNNPMRKDMLKSIEAGLEVGEDWYNSEELLEWFTTGYGPDEGLRQYHEFLDLIGAASPKLYPTLETRLLSAKNFIPTLHTPTRLGTFLRMLKEEH